MVSPADMVLFAVVVREGGFTAAARRLGITKQTVSERISALERRLQVRLLERTTRSVRVTGAGAGYYERCAAIAAQIDEANQELVNQNTEPVGLIRVSSPALYGRRYLSPIISRFLERHPKVQVELVLSQGNADPVEEGFDVVIHIGRLEDSSMVARPLGEAVTYVVASPRFLSRYGTPAAKALSRTRCIGFVPLRSGTWRDRARGSSRC